MTETLDASVPQTSVTSGSLTDMQAAFVRAYAEGSGKPGAAADAAQAAGYAPTSRAAARVRAHELLRNPNVLSALRDELTRRLNSAAAIGVNTLIELALSGPAHVRLAAAKELVDRGYGPVMSRSAVLQASFSVEDLLTQLDKQADDIDFENDTEASFVHPGG